MQTLTFTVDAKLLSELGERLVGRPHIALAELIKNSYDADARHVELTFEKDLIRIVDDGHGMSARSFTERWMRVGTTAKVQEQRSPALGRSLTGSKGVGRLSAQLLAHSLQLRSVAAKDATQIWSTDSPTLEKEIHASIDWPTAIRSKDLTDVQVEFETRAATSTFAEQSPHGTEILLSDLATDWSAEAFRDLAREIWALQPPFAVEGESDFRVTLSTPFESIQETFDDQMSALMDIASARITGKLLDPKAKLPKRTRRIVLNVTPRDDEESDGGKSNTGKMSPTRRCLIVVRLVGSATERYLVEIPDCQLDAIDFEIRVFDLVHRQPRGIKVDVARGYLSQFGGVNIYDAGFRLPYYGPEADWLRLELDHARRLSRSRLLPEAFQVKNAMQDLPTNKRVFGMVRVSTSAEERAARAAGRRPQDALAIQITRDRLVDNKALDQLTRVVRLSVDLYALVRAKAKAKDVVTRRRRSKADADEAARAAAETVESLKPQLPPEAFKSLQSSISALSESSQTVRDEARAYASLLGALATAGMTSLAYEHEVSKQRREVQAVARRLERLAESIGGSGAASLTSEAETLRAWSNRAKRIRSLFAPLLSEETRTAVDAYGAAKVLSDVKRTMQVLARGADVDLRQVPPNLVLPEASYAAWIAVFQNLLTNAVRATLDERPGRIAISGGKRARSAWLRVQNTGLGVDLDDSERLFLPFERIDSATERSEALGLGGSGLGLTIVRMIAQDVGCTVRFVEPEPGWSTSIEIEWKVDP